MTAPEDWETKYHEERQAHAETRSLLNHAEAVLADPCPMCLEFERERNEAVDELEAVRLRLDAEMSTRIWCEGMLRGQVTP